MILAIVALASCQTASDPYMTLETKSLSLEVDGGTANCRNRSPTCITESIMTGTDDAGNYWARITDTEVDGDATTSSCQVLTRMKSQLSGQALYALSGVMASLRSN